MTNQVAAAARHPSRAQIGRVLWQNKTLILMCLPAIAFFFVFCYMPMPGMYIAFVKYNYRQGIFGSPFVGLKNFTFLFTSGQLSLLLRNTVLYNLAFIIIGNVLQVFFAILLNEVRCRVFKKTTQSLMFLPYFISDVLVSLLGYNLLNFDFGFISNLVRSMGGEMPKIYQNASAWPLVIILVNIWKGTGYGTVVYFAAITSMDTSMLEAAQIDGANGFQKIRYIILPTLKPTMVVLFLFAIGGILRDHSDKRSLDSAECLVYHVIVLDHRPGQAQILPHIGIHAVGDHFDGGLRHDPDVPTLRAGPATQGGNNLGNVLRLITDALHVGDHLQRRGDHPQIPGHGLLLQQELETDGLDLPLQLVNTVSLLLSLAGVLCAALQQRLASGGNDALTLAAHLGHFPIQQLQLLVKSASHGITQTFL